MLMVKACGKRSDSSIVVMVSKGGALATFLGLFIYAAIGQTSGSAPNEQERTNAITRCQQMGRSLGVSTEVISEAIRRASPEQFPKLRDTCVLAYPERTVDVAGVGRGSELYKTYGCTVCHGKDARGGDGGPSLMRSRWLMRDRNGEVLADVVRKGIPNTRMPAFALKDVELADLADFLHSLQAGGASAAPDNSSSIVTGDPVAGRAYFVAKCASCHSVSRADTRVAADESLKDPKTLQQTWLMPRSTLPLTGIVKARDGSIAHGRVARVDEFQVTLVLADGAERTFLRSGDVLDVAMNDPLAAHKAMLAEYADADIHAVTAYLSGLRNAGQWLKLKQQQLDLMSEKAAASSEAESQLSTRPVSGAHLPPQAILQPAAGTWPTYSGDYSGRRYSPLAQINQSNVARLTLAWTTRLAAGASGSTPLIIAGPGKGDLFAQERAQVCGAVLAVGGVLYVSSSDNAWALNAHDGTVLWHFFWKTRGGWHFCNRGLAMWGGNLYLETPDAYLVSLDARTGKERWSVEMASFEEQYFASTAPVVVGNHVLVGLGNTLNAPGMLQSFDPETGALKWRRYSVPMNLGDPGLETWKDLDAARHGGGQVWIPGSYDPETKLYIYGTGNPTPTYSADLRGNGDALFTCALMAVDIETGKLAWYYQTSPNDTHDWDSAQTPVLADLQIAGRLRKVAMTAARNGYFFVVDRISGEHLVTGKFSSTANWAEPQLNARGQPVRIPDKDSHVSGALVSNANEGAINWQPASFSPDYGLFYTPVAESWALYYKTEADAGGAYSLVGKEELSVDADSYLKAIDPLTGSVAWSVKYPSRGGLANGVLTTAGRLLFSGDPVGNLVARDPANGRPLWHARVGTISNAPQTYMFDGQQYILIAAGDTLYAFMLQA